MEVKRGLLQQNLSKIEEVSSIHNVYFSLHTSTVHSVQVYSVSVYRFTLLILCTGVHCELCIHVYSVNSVYRCTLWIVCTDILCKLWVQMYSVNSVYRCTLWTLGTVVLCELCVQVYSVNSGYRCTLWTLCTGVRGGGQWVEGEEAGGAEAELEAHHHHCQEFKQQERDPKVRAQDIQVQLGWSDFCRKHLDTCFVMPNVVKDPIPKFTFKVAF